jgi:hypothetical protein
MLSFQNIRFGRLVAPYTNERRGPASSDAHRRYSDLPVARHPIECIHFIR